MASRKAHKEGKGEPFSVRFTVSTDRATEAEAQRTRRSKSAIVEALTEEAARTRRFPGIGFRGDDARRRPWVIGSGLDVWEVVQMLEDFGERERLLTDTELRQRQLDLALAYRDHYPDEIADAIAENRRPAHSSSSLRPPSVASSSRATGLAATARLGPDRGAPGRASRSIARRRGGAPRARGAAPGSDGGACRPTPSTLRRPPRRAGRTGAC